MKIFFEAPQIDIYDNGGSIENWWRLADILIGRLPALQVDQGADFFSQYSHLVPLPSKKPMSYYIDQLKSREWQFLRLQGRTILFSGSNHFFVIKVQKKELPSELNKEFSATAALKYFNGLKSKLSNPLDNTTLTSEDLFQLLPFSEEELKKTKFHELVNVQENVVYANYIYTVKNENKGLFTYLHDKSLSHNAYAESNAICVHDLCLLLRKKVVYTQLADIVHNQQQNTPINILNRGRRDLGRYIVLANLLAPTQIGRLNRLGSGRVSNHKGAVEWPDFRENNLTDFGDYTPLSELMEHGSWANEYFEPAVQFYQGKIGNYLIANYLAEIQYILLLIAGRRGCELTSSAKAKPDQTPDKIKHAISGIWLQLAEQIINNCVLMLNIFTHQQKNELRLKLEKIVDIQRLARQMQFWMTDEYISYVQQNTIPEDIYGSNVKVNISIDRFRPGTFHPKLGFSINGIDPDLGPVNGQEPIKEANKLLYWMIIILFSAYHEYRLMHEDIKKVIKEPDIEKSDALRKQSFFYLSKKRYHILQSSLCEHQLNKTLSIEKKFEYTNEIVEHKKTYAALIRQSMWRHQKIKSSSANTENERNKLGPS